VTSQHLLHRRRRHDDRIERIALAAADDPRGSPGQRGRQERQVVVEVLLEVRVVRLDHRQLVTPRPPNADRVRIERRLDVDDVDPRRVDRSQGAPQRGAIHQPVLRVERHAPRRNPQHTGSGLVALTVARRDDRAAMTEGREAFAKRRDRGRHAVDPRRKNVRDHQDMHEVTVRLPRCRRGCQRNVTPG
jgi:hypothetical protein